MDGVRVLRSRWLGVAAAVGYVAAVAGLEAARRSGGGPDPADLASSPAGVLAGRVWPLLTSSLPVAGGSLAQLAGTALAVGTTVVMLGPRIFWLAALVGHVVATLLSYLGVGVIAVLGADVDAVAHAPDYGISCVLAACLGALSGALARSSARRWTPAVVAAGAGVFALALPPSADLTGAEHALAWALGAGVGVRGPARGLFGPRATRAPRATPALLRQRTAGP